MITSLSRIVYATVYDIQLSHLSHLVPVIKVMLFQCFQCLVCVHVNQVFCVLFLFQVSSLSVCLSARMITCPYLMCYTCVQLAPPPSVCMPPCFLAFSVRFLCSLCSAFCKSLIWLSSRPQTDSWLDWSTLSPWPGKNFSHLLPVLYLYWVPDSPFSSAPLICGFINLCLPNDYWRFCTSVWPLKHIVLSWSQVCYWTWTRSQVLVTDINNQ